MPYTHSLVCWRASPRGECQAKVVLRLTRLTKIFWKYPSEKHLFMQKPRLRGLGTSFFIRFDLVLILAYAQNLKWLVQEKWDLLPQEKQGPLARQELDPLVRSPEAGSIGSTSVVSAYASVVYSYSDLPSDPASAWGSASEKDSTSSA